MRGVLGGCSSWLEEWRMLLLVLHRLLPVDRSRLEQARLCWLLGAGRRPELLLEHLREVVIVLTGVV